MASASAVGQVPVKPSFAKVAASAIQPPRNVSNAVKGKPEQQVPPPSEKEEKAVGEPGNLPTDPRPENTNADMPAHPTGASSLPANVIIAASTEDGSTQVSSTNSSAKPNSGESVTSGMTF
ncbi:hypothetical protein LTS18_001044, partial [Coniosporium uncinatum]